MGTEIPDRFVWTKMQAAGDESVENILRRKELNGRPATVSSGGESVSQREMPWKGWSSYKPYRKFCFPSC